MCSLNQLYLTAEQHAHSTPWVSELAQGPFAPGAGTSYAGGHQVRELASSPLAQVAPLGGVGADTGLMGSTRQTGAYQTACDHNQQWQRTMNAIIYKNTVQVSLSRSLLRLFTLTLVSRGSVEGLWPCGYSRQQDCFRAPRAAPPFILHRHQARSVRSCSFFTTNCTTWWKGRGRHMKPSGAEFFKLCAGGKKKRFSLGATLR